MQKQIVNKYTKNITNKLLFILTLFLLIDKKSSGNNSKYFHNASYPITNLN